MKPIQLIFAVISVLSVLSGCVSLDSVSVTQIPVNRSQKVKAEAERFIVLGFNFDNDYVNAITSDLKNQCANGTVTGILTKTESIDYFLFIFWKKRVTASGFCVPGKLATGGTDPKKRRPTGEGDPDNADAEFSQEPM